MNQNSYFRSLCFWSMGIKYLHLVRVNAEQVVDAKNRTVATWWGDRTIEEEASELDRQTKWSDERLLEPLLFNFFHGLELLLKGFILSSAGTNQKLDHRISRLLKSFMIDFPNEHELIKVFKKYLTQSEMPELLSSYLIKNEISVDRFYESLRYPFDRKFNQNYKYIMIKYKGRKGLPFFEELITDIRSISRMAVSLGRNIEKVIEQMNTGATSESSNRSESEPPDP